MPAILLAFGSLLITLLRQYLPGIVGRILLAFGIGLVTYNVGLPMLRNALAGYISNLPPMIQAYVGALGIDVCAVMLFSTFAAIRAQRVILSKLEPSS